MCSLKRVKNEATGWNVRSAKHGQVAQTVNKGPFLSASSILNNASWFLHRASKTKRRLLGIANLSAKELRTLANERTWRATECAVAPETTLGTVAAVITATTIIIIW